MTERCDLCRAKWRKKFLQGTIVLSVLCFLLSGLCFGQNPYSVLNTGTWYKVGVEKNGVYKITYDQLKKMGFDVARIDPRKIKVYGWEGGMLPQPNSTPRPRDLVELSIIVSGENDGVFNSQDYILFYAQGANRVSYNTTKDIFSYEANLYSKKNFYFITVSDTNGERIPASENLAGSFPIISTFDDFIYHELDEQNVLKSGREWFGEHFQLTTERAFDYTVEGIVENSNIKLVSDVVAYQSFNESSFKVLFNNQVIAEQPIAPIPNSQYGLKGRHKRDTIIFNVSQVSAASLAKQQIKYQFQKGSSYSTEGFLDFFLVSFKRKLALYGEQTIFRSAESLLHSNVQYQMTNVPSNALIWDVTNPYKPQLQSFTAQSGSAAFSTSSSLLKEFIIFNSKIPSPELIGKTPNQNLNGLSEANLIIISHPSFISEAQRLAYHRQSHSGLSTAVVTTEQVYNEFSSGRQDVTAIRDFVKFLYDKNPAVLKSLLLFGKCSYDYKDRLPRNTNFVPTYESRNSLSPLETYSSDDYFGFLESHEGNWAEGSQFQNHTLDIGVGRLPVKSIEEAKAVVDKIIDYDVNKKALGRWRKNIVFVADDGSNSDGFTSIHQSQANTMAENIETLNPQFDTRKIFLGTYQKTPGGNGETIPKAKDDLINDFERGALIINYTGHGSEKLWADEKIFTDEVIKNLDNKLYPFLVTATCEFGRQDNPGEISSAELSIIKEKSGSVGLVTTARPVNSSTNFSLNQAFYQALFQKENNRYLTLGEIFRRTKNNSTSGVANRNFSLLGDPSLTLAIPSLTIDVTQIKTASGSDTLKALSKVIVTGEIKDEENNVVTDFNGILEALLFDKKTDFVTIGKNNPPFSFQQWHNPLFKGKASVQEGKFEFEFIIPKNISYEVDYGKLSLYAFDEKNLWDAGGVSSSFKIGGSESNEFTDTSSPTIQLFMGDTTFINGGIVSSNTTLVARLNDESGINISNYGIGNTMIAILDNDQQVYILNEYYEADVDDFTKGWIHYPIKGLPPGKHTLTVKVWDTYNNPAQAKIDFVVTDGETLVIESFTNSPNPVQDETTLFFTHNRAGDDLEAILYFYSVEGLQLGNYQFSIPSSPYRVSLLKLNTQSDFGKKLPGGLYLARLAVRSLTNGSKNEQVTKLIILN